ncbi:MAG: PAAR-like domain-containing protein, partial [Pseudomonadota bacterium]
MANKFWARKDSKYTVVSSAPSVNLTQVGNQVVPIPYPVSQKLSKAVATSKDVLVNGKQTYIHGSDTTSVVGDGRGSKGGIKSGTVEAKSQPIVAMASPTVKVNKQRVVREGDLQYMQGGNTIGKITCSESASLVTISDKGAIEGEETLPSDLDQASANQHYQSADQPLARQSMPRQTKPTASGGSGELGAMTGSPVILQTGQLFYTYRYHDLQLAGLMPLDLALHYLSDRSYKGYFGHNRCFGYEKRWVQIEQQRYRLYQANGREFDFYDSGQGFVDIGHLGVSVQSDGDTFILCYPDQQREIYRHKRLVRIEDAHQNAIQLDYSTDGLLQSIHNSSGASLAFDYSPQGLISTMVDQGGRTWGYDYDQSGHLIKITPPQGMAEHYRYQREDKQPARLCSIQNSSIQNSSIQNGSIQNSSIQNSPDKPTLQVTYDDLGRVNSYQENQARYSYVYHTAHLVEKINAQGQSTLYGLDDYGIISAISFADGSTQREEYDPKTRTAK